MFIKIILILAIIGGAFLAIRLFFFLVRSTLGIGWGIVKAFVWGLLLLVIVGVIVYFYLRLKMVNFFDLGL